MYVYLYENQRLTNNVDLHLVSGHTRLNSIAEPVNTRVVGIADYSETRVFHFWELRSRVAVYFEHFMPV